MNRFRFVVLAVTMLISTTALVLLSIHAPDTRTERIARQVAGTTIVSGDRRLADVEQELAQLRLQLDSDRRQLRRELQAQRDEVARFTRALADSEGCDPAAAHDRPEPEPAAEELERADHEREQRQLAQLEAVFDREPEDGAWSRHATVQIANAAEQITYGSVERSVALVDARCRASLCRLELTGSDAHALNGFSVALPSQLGWQGSMKQTLVSEPDGSLTSILYVSRDGQDLPAEVAAL